MARAVTARATPAERAQAAERAKAELPAAVKRPAGLSREAKAVWAAWAPAAISARTLTAATVDDFRDLCELVVEMRSVLRVRRSMGWTDEALRFAREYRGLVLRVEAKRRAFRLAPIGKEMDDPEPAQAGDPFDEFDQAPPAPKLTVVQGGKNQPKRKRRARRAGTRPA